MMGNETFYFLGISCPSWVATFTASFQFPSLTTLMFGFNSAFAFSFAFEFRFALDFDFVFNFSLDFEFEFDAESTFDSTSYRCEP
jgi:hypothetical protein